MLVPPALLSGGRAEKLGGQAEEFPCLLLEKAIIRVPTIIEARVMILQGDEEHLRGHPDHLDPDGTRQELEAPANARKSEARLRERARIALLAAAGHGSRAIGRELHATLEHQLDILGANPHFSHCLTITEYRPSCCYDMRR
jgi:hypothetical protein